MPKSVKSSKKTGRKPALTSAQKQAKATYMHERSKLLKNIRSLEKRGYTVNISVPKIPVRSFEKATEKIRQLNEKRYERSSKTISRIVTDKKTGKDKVIQEKVKGTRAVKAERAESARKGVEKRHINKQIKELEWVAETERINDIKSGHIFAQEGYIETQNKIRRLKGIDEQIDENYEYHMTADDWAIYNEYNGGYSEYPEPEEPDYSEYMDPTLDKDRDYVYNPETGEIIPLEEMPQHGVEQYDWWYLRDRDVIDKRYENIMGDMDKAISGYDASNYTDFADDPLFLDPKELKDKITEMYKEDPYDFYFFTEMVESHPDYETAELYYKYGHSNYGKFAIAYLRTLANKSGNSETGE